MVATGRPGQAQAMVEEEGGVAVEHMDHREIEKEEEDR